MILEQTVYQPVLNQLSISPRSKKVYEGDTVNLKVIFIDQMNKTLPEEGYTVFWSLLEGDGTLINQTANRADFVAGSEGKAVIEAAVDTIYVKSTITIQAIETGTVPISESPAFAVFPNPACDILYIEFECNGPSDLQIQLFTLNGRRVKEERQTLSAAGPYTVAVKIKDLEPGNYLYKIEFAGKLFTGKVVVQRKI